MLSFLLIPSSGSPAYDSVRSLAYHEADVFLLCYKIADPISLYNAKNKWIGEVRRHRPDAPVILCGCQTDLRNDPVTISHLCKTGRAPVSREQALAICCEIGADHYAETNAREPGADGLIEVFELCASTAIKHKNDRAINNNNNNSSQPFKRSPSIHSSISLSLFPTDNNNAFHFKRSPSTHSNLSLAANFNKGPSQSQVSHQQHYTQHQAKLSNTSLVFRNSLASLKSPSGVGDENRPPPALRTFSPEPLSISASTFRIPPVITEDETYQHPTASNNKHNRRILHSRPTSLCEPLVLSESSQSRPLQRPTSLFKAGGSSISLNYSSKPQPLRGAGFFTPTAESLTSSSEAATPTPSTASNSLIKSPQMDVVWPSNAQVRPNCLARRTAFRTHPKMAIPVATPMSPVGEINVVPMCQSPQSMTSDDCDSSILMNNELSSICAAASPMTTSPPPEPRQQQPQKLYESLKSQMSSTSSESGSSGKFVSDLSDAASSVSCTTKKKQRLVLIGEELGMPDTEDPRLLNNLNFVSPKTGVYRPNGPRKSRHQCAVM